VVKSEVDTHLDPPDTYGNVTHFTQTWQQSAGASDERDVVIEYLWEIDPSRAPGFSNPVPSLDTWQVDLVHKRTERSSVPALVAAGDLNAMSERVRQFEYFPNGLLRQGTRAPEDPTALIQTTFVRDTYGNPTTITVNDRVTTIVYDSTGLMPTLVTNAKGQQTQVAVDSRFGELTQTTDPNGLVTDWWFDDFGRLRTEILQDNTRNDTDYLSSVVADKPYHIVHRETGGETNTVDYDVLDRPVTTHRSGVSGQIVQNLTYDLRGLMDSVERPHKTSLLLAETVLLGHDDLGRVTSETHPDGGQFSHCYRGRVHCLTNARGFTSCSVLDPQGRVIRSIDPGATSTTCEQGLAAAETSQGTNYTFGAFGHLRFVDNVLGNRTNFLTDTYGRPSTLQDPDLGTRSFIYDPLDELSLSSDELRLRHEAWRHRQDPTIAWELASLGATLLFARGASRAGICRKAAAENKSQVPHLIDVNYSCSPCNCRW